MKIIFFLGLFFSLSAHNVQQLLEQADMAFKQQHYAEALADCCKAKKMASYKELSCINNNIEIIYKKIGIKESKKCIDYLIDYTKLLSPLLWKLLVLFFWYLFCILIMVGYHTLKPFIVLNCFLLIFAGGGLAASWYATYGIYGFTQEAILKIGPGDYYHTIGAVQLGDYVKIVGQRENWIFVQHKKIKGWLKQDEVYLC